MFPKYKVDLIFLVKSLIIKNGWQNSKEQTLSLVWPIVFHLQQAQYLFHLVITIHNCHNVFHKCLF